MQVQLQLLTATVKLFLKRPQGAAQTMIGRVLSCATNDTDNPDLRDRAYIYWRLLSTDPEVGHTRRDTHTRWSLVAIGCVSSTPEDGSSARPILCVAYCVLFCVLVATPAGCQGCRVE